MKKDLILKTISNFNYENIRELKDSVNSFMNWNTEKEIENNSFVTELKKWMLTREIFDILRDIKEKINIDEIDFVTYTPDSWNWETNKIQWFSLIVEYISMILWKKTLVPEINKNKKINWKQKNQKNLQDRMNNRRWMYKFNKDLTWKKLLFIDDLLTTWATFLSISEDIIKNNWEVESYFIANVKKEQL